MKRYGAMLDNGNMTRRLDNNLFYIIISLLVFSSIITITLVTNILTGTRQIEPHGAVSSDVKVCSNIGIEQMKIGGNGVDSAIATLFCLGVVNSGHSGIGGGGFMLIYSHLKNESLAIDFRETLPLGIINPFASKGATIGIPGEVKGMYLAHRIYGKRPWKDLITPAADLATYGFVITAATEKALKKKFKSPQDMLQNYPRLAQIYVKEESTGEGSTAIRFIRAGETTKNPALGRTLKAIAAHGPSAFYEGPIAQNITDTVNAANGAFTSKEMYDFQPVLRQPQMFTFMDGRYTGITFPPPGAGPRLSLVLELLERLGLPHLLRKSMHDKRAASHYYERYKKDANFMNKLYPSVSKKILDIQEKESLMVDSSPPENLQKLFPISSANSDGALDDENNSMERFFNNLPSKYTALYYHWLIEAMKFSQAYAQHLSDPTLAVLEPKFFVNNSTPTVSDIDTQDNSRSKFHPSSGGPSPFGYATDAPIPQPNFHNIIAAISNQTTFLPFSFADPVNHYDIAPLSPLPNRVGTAHLSVLDNDEMFVSVTSTLNNIFGSKIMTIDGILLNDEMDDFSSPETRPKSLNLPKPGMRPLSSMVPTIIYETAKPCGLRLVIGGSNGSRIPSGIAQVLFNLLAFEDSLEMAIARPRLYHDPENNVVEYESNFPEEILNQLRIKNHTFKKVTEGLNSVIPIMKIKDTIWATSDPRKSSFQSAVVY